jgi:hypothetical protein
MIAGPAGIGSLQAQDLPGRLQISSTQVEGLLAEVSVFESGRDASVPERTYEGTLRYAAPESLQISLEDTTIYANDTWIPNDLNLTIANGILVATGSPACPRKASPDCQTSPSTIAITDLPPFDPGVVIPLEIIGPGRSLWEGLEVTGSPTLDGVETVQVRTTVAGAELLAALTMYGSWRDLYPTDEVRMWLDAETLIPLRLEVFPTTTEQRQLWQIRRGYTDVAGRPLLTVDIDPLSTVTPTINVTTPLDARSAGFVDVIASPLSPDLPESFETHRNGYWVLPDGGRVDVASWSDGRAWIMVETTSAWREPHLFGMETVFVSEVELGNGSIGYVSPDGDGIAVHGDGIDLFVSGSVETRTLSEVASSLGIPGRRVPEAWAESAVLPLEELPQGTLVPRVEWWSAAGSVANGITTILLTGGGERSILITQESGPELPPPMGPDQTAIPLRGTIARYDDATTTLAWIENDRLIRLRSESVSLDELVTIASSMDAE